MCVVGSTIVLTDEGQIPIEDLENKTFKTWDGKKWEKSTAWKSEEEETFLISFSDGDELECGNRQSFIIDKRTDHQRKYDIHKDKRGLHPVHVDKIEKIRCCDLENKAMLLKWSSDFDPLEGNEGFKYPKTAGMYTADGYFCSQMNLPYLRLYSYKKDWAHEYDSRYPCLHRKDNVIVVYPPKDLPSKFSLPWNSSLHDKLQWLSGLFEGDGTFECFSKTHYNIKFSSIHLEFLKKLKTFLLGIGIQSKILPPQVSIKPRRTGENDDDYTTLYRINIAGSETFKLKKMGLTFRRPGSKYETIVKPTTEKRQINKVKKITPLKNGKKTLYCLKSAGKKAVISSLMIGTCK